MTIYNTGKNLLNTQNSKKIITEEAKEQNFPIKNNAAGLLGCIINDIYADDCFNEIVTDLALDTVCPETPTPTATQTPTPTPTQTSTPTPNQSISTSSSSNFDM